MQARLKLSLALLAAAVPLAGCGGGSSSSDQTSTFKKAFQPIEVQLQATGQAVGSALQQAPSGTDQQLSAAFKGLASRWQGQVNRLKALNPPAKVSADFKKMTGAATRFESDLTAISAAAATHSKSAAQ